jgi:hypothetical protein
MLLESSEADKFVARLAACEEDVNQELFARAAAFKWEKA